MRSTAFAPIVALGLLLCASSACKSDDEAKDRNYGTNIGKDFMFPDGGWASIDAAAVTADAATEAGTAEVGGDAPGDGADAGAPDAASTQETGR